MPGFISEIRYEGGTSNDFIEIVVPTGTDTSAYTVAIYDNGGNYLTSLPLGTVDATLAGNDGYVIPSTDPGFTDIRHNFTTALVDDTGTVIQLLAHTTPIVLSGGPANGMTGTSSGVAKTTDTQSIQSDDGGATYFMQAAPNAGTIPCYAPGTLIDTPDGPREVETLRVGDLVETLDHGPMPIRWLRQGEHDLTKVRLDQKPVLIAAGAFGPDCPAQDLIISPQHRILVGAAGQLDGIFGAQYFAPAKALTGLPSIRAMMGVDTITWVHFALDTHEVVWANGCLSESLLLGPMVLQGLTELQRRAVTRLYGAPAEGAALNGPAARDCLRVRDLQRTINRLARHDFEVAEAA